MLLQERLNHMTFSSSMSYPTENDHGYSKIFIAGHRVESNHIVPEIYDTKKEFLLMFYQAKDNTLIVDTVSRTASNRFITPIQGNQSAENPPLLKHNYLEIMYVLRGSMTFLIEDKTITCSPGHGCVFNNNINHAVRSFGDCFGVSVILKPDFIQEALTQEIRVTLSHSFSKTFLHLLDPPASEKEKKKYVELIPIVPYERFSHSAETLLEQLLAEMAAQEMGYSSICCGLLLRFLSFLDNETYYTKLEKNEGGSHSEQIFIALTRELEKSKGRVYRKELEEKLHYSSNYLNKICKKYFGDSLVKYGQLFLLKEAESLLLNTNLPVNDIMEQLGFSNKSYFYRLFTEKNNMSPSQYRQTFKNS